MRLLSRILPSFSTFIVFDDEDELPPARRDAAFRDARWAERAHVMDERNFARRAAHEARRDLERCFADQDRPGAPRIVEDAETHSLLDQVMPQPKLDAAMADIAAAVRSAAPPEATMADILNRAVSKPVNPSFKLVRPR